MNVSRKDIYTYVGSLFTSLSLSMYRVTIPNALTANDTTNGFILFSLGDIRDNSEFSLETYGQVRMIVSCFVPATSKGLMNSIPYYNLQNNIDAIINAESKKVNQQYNITKDLVLSSDDFWTNNTNSFYVYTTSFTINL